MTILVTGGAGFIGSNLAKHLAKQSHEVLVVDDFQSGAWTNLVDFAGDVHTADLAEPSPFLESLARVDVIFHQASITDTTVMDQHRMMRNNVEAFRRLLDLAVRWGSRVVWASSAATYGRGEAPMREAQPATPLNVYGYSKLAMEHLTARYQPKLKHPIVGLRYFNVYGPGENHKGKFACMIGQLARQMRAGKRPRIFTNGNQKRDFVYIDDVIAANMAGMNAKTGGVFNVGSGAAYSFNEVVAQLNRTLKLDLQPEYFENPYDFFQNWTEADLTHSRKILGYNPQFNLARGVEAYAASGSLGV